MHKQSKIPWIGEIPENWEVKKLKYLASLYNGNSIKDEEKDNYRDDVDAIPYISTKDISIDSNEIDYDNGMFTKVTDSNFKVANRNCILLCIEG